MLSIKSKLLLCSILAIFATVGTSHAALSDFETGYYTSTENYRIPWAFYDPFKGSSAPAGEKFPLLIYLHGSGNSGYDNIAGPASHPNASVLVNNAKNASTRAYVVIPQSHSSWQATDAAYRSLREFIAELVAEHAIDTDRVYMTGFSLGGIGVFSISGYYPDDVAVIVPMAGSASYFGGENETAMANRATVATWAFSGNLDGTVPPSSAETSLENQAAYGCRPCFTIYASAGHNQVWDEVRNRDQDGLFSWMYAQKNGQPQDDSMFIGWPINEQESVVWSSETKDFDLDFFCGYYGRGDLTIGPLAEVNSRKGYIAAQGGSRGNVTVTGMSAWNCSGSMYVGDSNNGVASLHIDADSSVSCDTMTVNQFSYLSGSGTLNCTELRTEGEVNPGGIAKTVEFGNPVSFGGRYVYPVTSSLSGIDLDADLPLGDAGDNIGTLFINGQCRFYSKNTLNIDMSAAGCDSIEATGPAYLAGDLVVNIEDDFSAEEGDEFVIVSGSTVAGSFADEDGLTGPLGLYLEVVYGSTEVKLVAHQRLAGDVDYDGHVDMFDFSIFKMFYGKTSGATWQEGDYDGDGDIDIFDFMRLKANYGK